MLGLLATATLLALTGEPKDKPVVQPALSCPLRGLDAATTATLGADLMATMADAPAPPGVDRAVEKLGAGAIACKEEHGWADKRLETVLLWMVTQAALPAMQTRLRTMSVNIQAVDRAVARLTPAERGDLTGSKATSSMPGETLLAHVMAEGQALLLNDDAKIEAIGTYAGLVIMSDKSAADAARP